MTVPYTTYFIHAQKKMDEIVPIVKQLCIPRILREDLMVAYHDNKCHIGQERLYNSLKMKYWFPLMYSTVLQYVASCALCQRTKTSQHRKKAPLKPLEVVEPFGRVHMDFVGPLPKLPRGTVIFWSWWTARPYMWKPSRLRAPEQKKWQRSYIRRLSLGTGWWESFCPIKDRRLRIS